MRVVRLMPAWQLKAMGVAHIAVVYDEKEDVNFKALPGDVETHERAELMAVQNKFREIEGVSVRWQQPLQTGADEVLAADAIIQTVRLVCR